MPLRAIGLYLFSAICSIAACAQTTVSLQLAANPVPQGNVAVATATVMVSGAPAKVGVVDLYDGTKLISSIQITGIASAYGTIGNAVFRRIFAPGSHSLTAIYRGTRTIGAGTSPVTSLMVLGTPPVDLGLQYAGTTSFYNNGNWDFMSTFALSDLNLDGLPDIAALQFVEGEVALGWGSALNPGKFNTSNSFIQPGFNEAEQVFTPDLNGDGLPDLVVVLADVGFADVYLATAPGIFSAPQRIYLSTTISPQVAIADFNGDGLPDIVAVSSGAGGTSTLAAFFNNPASPGNFLAQPTISLAIPEGVGWLQVADLNGDGLPDLIASASNYVQTQATVILNNSASPGLSWSSTTYNLGVPTWHTTVADLNGDGLPDLVAGTFNGSVLVALNDSSHPGNLLPSTQFPAPALMQGNYIAGVAAGYIDADNFLDVVATDYNNHFVVFRGNGDGTLTPDTPITVGPTPLAFPDQMFAWSNSGVAIADVDGDGLGDVVLTELRQNLAQVYRHVPSPNALIQTATDLSSTPAQVDYGQPIILTADETATAGVMSGTVTFQDSFGNATMTTVGTAPIVSGVATFTIPNPTVGAHDYVAIFYGDSTFAASQSSILPVVFVSAIPITIAACAAEFPFAAIAVVTKPAPSPRAPLLTPSQTPDTQPGQWPSPSNFDRGLL